MSHQGGFSLDWGSVPEWFAGLSLVLAYVIFSKDRRERERSQINLIGVWTAASWDDKYSITHKIVVRNSSVLPLMVENVKYDVQVTWSYGRSAGVEEVAKGPLLEVVPDFVPEAALPQSDWIKESTWNPPKPEKAIRLAGVVCELKSIRLTDNSLRAWRLGPGGGLVREHLRRGIWQYWPFT
jgi:hypothetical protein